MNELNKISSELFPTKFIRTDMKIKILSLRRNAILMILVAVNVVCLLTISYFQVARAPGKGGKDVEYQTTVEPTPVNKILKIKQDLNVSHLPDDANHLAEVNLVLFDPQLCLRGGNILDIIFIVHTAPENLHKRQRIRETFGNALLFSPFHVRVAFLLGRTRNTTLQTVLWFEHATYNDTVMGDFIDSYHNLSLKGIMGYSWVSRHCSNSKFVVKIDDDVVVNTYKLLFTYYTHMNGKRKSIFCNLWKKDSMPIQRSGKWKIESNMFPDKNAFPFDYCSGLFVVMTTDLMDALYVAAIRTPIFWIDDIYLFGMLPYVVGGVTYYNYALDKYITLKDQSAIECIRTQGPKCPLVAILSSDSNFMDIWSLIKQTFESESIQVENKVVI
ncbi:beta-1,3-galactosyltransferase 1 [Biomphalaria glabrata]|nr:beta-1,3-galactosyltransferase 1 [Biomphalaria glabrata]